MKLSASWTCVLKIAAVVLCAGVLPNIVSGVAHAQAPTAEFDHYGDRHHNNNKSGESTRKNTNRNGNNAAGKSTTAAKKPKMDLTTILGMLKLTPGQKSETDRDQVKAEKDGKVAYADRSLSQDQFIAKMDKIHSDLIASIRTRLTPEQTTQFNSLIGKEN